VFAYGAGGTEALTVMVGQREVAEEKSNKYVLLSFSHCDQWQ
jgi:hypothetical protein